MSILIPNKLIICFVYSKYDMHFIGSPAAQFMEPVPHAQRLCPSQWPFAACHTLLSLPVSCHF